MAADRTAARYAPGAVALVWMAAVAIWERVRDQPHAHLLAIAVAFDLTLTAALAFYLFARRSRGAVGVAVGGLLLATLAVGPVRPFVIVLEPAMFFLALTRTPRLMRAYRIRRAAGDSAHEALAASLGDVFHMPTLGHALATEVTVMVLAVTGWFRRPPKEGFFVVREEWESILKLVLLLVAAESTVVHLILSRIAPTLALSITVLTAYSVLWLLGDYQALRLYPSTVTGGQLHLRVGLRWSTRLRLTAIAGAQRTDSLPNGCFDASVAGPPNVVVRANGVAIGPFGIRRQFSDIALAVEKPESFIAALDAT